MALRDIRVVPNPVLRAMCAHVTVFDAALRDLTRDMLDTMYAANGRGLAAPQVGVTARIFVMDAAWKSGAAAPQVFVNPQMVRVSQTHATLDEGCLSIPGQLFSVTRPDEITLRWADMHGQEHNGDFSGFAAACVQHEIDHLDGILINNAEKLAI